MKSDTGIRPLYQQDPKTFALAATPIYASNTPEKKSYRTQAEEVDRDEATIEAEKGETILTPQMEHYTIGGKLHTQGGTPLDPEAGSFIFSNDKNLKIKGPVLKEFGINPETDTAKKGMTPADIAKQYKTNKFVAILRDEESTELDKDTANMVIANMKRKLGKLAFLQESLKGFPDGIPDVSNSPEDEQQASGKYKKGGLIKAQQGKQVTDLIRKMARQAHEIPSGYQLIGTEGTKSYYMKPGQPGSNPIVVPNSGSGSPAFNKAFAAAREQKLNTFKFNGKDYNTQLAPNKYTPGKAPTPNDYLFTDRPVSEIPNNRITTGPPNANITAHPPSMDYNPDLKTYSEPFYDTGYGTIDYINMAAPWLIPIKKYPPIRTHVNPEQLQFNPLDLEAQRQAIKGQAEQAQNSNAILSSSASEQSVRNSQLLGQVLDPLNQSFGNEFNANQAGRTQIEGMNAQARQQANLYNAQADDLYNTRTAFTNENFDNEKRLRLQQFLKGLNTAERSRQVRNAGNVINRDFMVLANGQIVRKPTSYDPERQYLRLTGDTSGGAFGEVGDGTSFEEYKASLPADVRNDLKPGQMWAAYQAQIGARYRAKDVQGIEVTTRNPYMVPQPFEYSVYPNQ